MPDIFHKTGDINETKLSSILLAKRIPQRSINVMSKGGEAMAMERWRPRWGITPWRPLRELEELERRFEDIFGRPAMRMGGAIRLD